MLHCNTYVLHMYYINIFYVLHEKCIQNLCNICTTYTLHFVRLCYILCNIALHFSCNLFFSQKIWISSKKFFWLKKYWLQTRLFCSRSTFSRLGKGRPEVGDDLGKVDPIYKLFFYYWFVIFLTKENIIIWFVQGCFCEKKELLYYY